MAFYTMSITLPYRQGNRPSDSQGKSGACAGGYGQGYGNCKPDMEIRPEGPEREGGRDRTNKQKETE